MQLSRTFITSVEALSEARRAQNQLYLEFLRIPMMSAGLYALDVGATDPQMPHTEDEIYYVVSGRGRFRLEEQDYAVAAGSVIFVPALSEHRFHNIEEALTIVVIFAPAETTHASPST